MSEIPYIFETPVPCDFRKNGWFKCDNTLKFVTWGFSRCSTKQRTIAHDYKKIVLQPFQFIFGRKTCSLETNMSEREVRTQLTLMINSGFIKNVTNGTTKRYTVLEWVTGAFSKIKDQQNDHPATKRRPSDDHNLEEEKGDIKTTTPNPQKENVGGGGGDLAKSIKFVKLCKEKEIPIEERLLNEMYRKHPEASIKAVENLYARMIKNDTLPANLGGWFRKEVVKEDEYLKLKQDYA